MKNVTRGRLSEFIEEMKKGCHAELVSASSARESKFRWTLNQVQGDSLTVSTGFTLIELLVVVLIIGILAAIAVPQYQLAVYKARFVRVMPLVNKLVEAQEIYYMANGSYSRDLNELDVSFPSSCTYEQTSTAKNWEYDQLLCPEATIHISVSYGGITAYVKGCPIRGGRYIDYCATYTVPYRHSHSLMGKGPYCSPYTAKGVPSVEALGEKVCLSLGGQKETNGWGTKYYL